MDDRVLLGALVELAGLETEHAEAEAAVARYRRRQRHLDELDAELRDDTAEADAAVDEARVAARRRQGELRDAELRLADRRERLVGLTDRRQHRALQEEIAALEQRIDRLETDALESLETTDRRREEASATAEDERRRAERSLGELESMGEAARRAEAALAEIGPEIERLVSLLPPAVGGRLKRLRANEPPAVAWLHVRTCGGCGAQLPAQVAVDAARGRKPATCPTCQRFVVGRPYGG